MNSFVAILCFSFLIFNAQSADDHCEKDAEKFGQCVGEDLAKHRDDDDKKLDKVWERINQCFNDSACEGPSTFRTPVSQDIRDFWATLPKDGKTCIANAHAKIALRLVNQCLKEEKVEEIKERVLEENDLDQFSNESLPHHRILRGFEKTVLALRKCRADKGAKAANATVKCASTIKKDVTEVVCKRLDKCRKDKVSDTCFQKGQKVEKALCDCGKSKLKDVIKSVESFESKGKDVSAEDLFKTLCPKCADDEKEMLDDVAKCFKAKKVTFEDTNSLKVLGAYLTATVHDPTGPVHAIITIFEDDEGTYSKSDLSEAIQILHDVLDNFDCGCAK